jgi:hypothetical protein
MAAIQAAWGQQQRAGRQIQDRGGGAVVAVRLVGVMRDEKLEAADAGVYRWSGCEVVVCQAVESGVEWGGSVELDHIEGGASHGGDRGPRGDGPPAAHMGHPSWVRVMVRSPWWVQGQRWAVASPTAADGRA